MNSRGKFIVFEGTDGSGKSTQLRLLAKYFKEKNIPCYVTHEPTDSPFGAILRACMNGRIDADERTIALLFAADRMDHIQNSVNGIRAKLDAGFTVLCDRYYFSSFAYNGGFVPLEWVTELNRPAMELLRADLTIYLDVDPEEGMRRVGRRSEKERYETLEQQKRIREKYFEVFKQFGDKENIAVVKSRQSKEETQERLRRLADELFGGTL